MNRALYIIAIPALITSVCWFTFAYGWRKAVPLTLLELAVFIGGVIYVRRKYKASSQ
ncbi:MAG: hypothetical protein WCA98_00860 [Candidatus Acidiferrales bacterium]